MRHDPAVVSSDFRIAFRSLLAAPIETVVTVLSISLGVGAVSALFSAVDAVWIEPLPYPEPHQLVALTLGNPFGS